MWLWASLILCPGTWELWLWPHCASSSAICLLMLHLLPELTQNLATEMGFLSAWVMICRRATAAVPELFLFTSHRNSSRKFRKYNLFYASALRIPACGLSDPRLGNQPPVMNPEWRAGNWNFPLLMWCHLRDPKYWSGQFLVALHQFLCCLFYFKPANERSSQAVQKTMRNHPQR